MGAGRVTGIGGFFLRAQDPGALAAWYRENLGIVATKSGEPDPDGNWSWAQEAGDTAFAMFAKDSDYFPADRQFMLNLRVEDLDALLDRLEAAGAVVSHREAMEGVGSFARIHDPEGNPLELWEPPAED
ncbi:VOC family protein [Altererythrobacter salegens]|uniref:VOC family protein n=1 Tax=Croceibacterium salegens TaxID=1737568 RepID=A0A6I4SQV1_9SPHN|nr:VOC family protein [Croceibacterium salegens]MXO58185.1 VOC family protein [Croceibacterium salegens]